MAQNEVIEKCTKKKIKKDLDYANQVDFKKNGTKEFLSKKLNYFQDKM